VIHFWTSGRPYLLCGDDVGSETVSFRPRDATCPACRNILDEWARGTVARTMRRRLILQTEGAIANNVLSRRGYPLPDGQLPRLTVTG
jgi:hypothetical protein